MSAFAQFLVGTMLAILLSSSAIGQQHLRDEPADALDVLFLAADGPLWLKLRFEATSEGIHGVRLRYARLLIQSVDADDDGAANADEASQLPANGRPGPNVEPLGDRWLQFDTAPKDGRLSAEELLGYLDPLLGPRITNRRKPPLLVQSVQLLSRLDQDHDHRVSAAEIVEATQALRQFDFDDDGTFSPAELQPFPQAMVDAAMSLSGDGEDQSFLVIDESTDRASVIDQILTRYGGEGVPPEQSGLPESAFEEMDQNRSTLLEAMELQTFLERPRPLAEISINLSAGRVSLKRVKRGSDLVEEITAESPRRLALRLGSEFVEFSARDNRYAAADQINLVRIGFMRSDADRNGYMGSGEFAALQGVDASFEDVDVDGDGKLFLEELDQYIRQDSYLSQCALEMEVETVEKPLFRILDTNLDRRLTSREFASIRDRIGEFDHDGNGVLDARELDLQRRFRVRFAFVVPPAIRPDRTSQMAATRRMPVTNRARLSGPQWFQNMDRNQDGDVTWREFLGPREEFDRLDFDQSGWIDESEAVAKGN